MITIRICGIHVDFLRRTDGLMPSTSMKSSGNGGAGNVPSIGGDEKLVFADVDGSAAALINAPNAITK